VALKFGSCAICAKRKEDKPLKKVMKKLLALGLVATLSVSGAQVSVAAADSPTTSVETTTQTNVTVTRPESTSAVTETAASSLTKYEVKETLTISAPESSSDSNSESDVEVATVTVNTGKTGVATIYEIEETAAKAVTVPKAIEVDGVKYTVTCLQANALENATEAEKIVIPSTITAIKAEAFSGLSETVTTVKFNCTEAPHVNADAFKGVDTKKLTIKVSSKMTDKELKKFEKRLKKAGFEGTVKRTVVKTTSTSSTSKKTTSSTSSTSKKTTSSTSNSSKKSTTSKKTSSSKK
jgi:hypothetical protein